MAITAANSAIPYSDTPAEGLRSAWMPSSISRDPARPDDDFKAQQKLEFDRWRTATVIVEHMREAGISCELANDLSGIRLGTN
jgi:hypothetical protein